MFFSTNIFKKIIFFSVFLFSPILVQAQSTQNQPPTDGQVFKARVVSISEEKYIQRENGSKTLQQNLVLRGLEKEWRDKEVKYIGISDIDVANVNAYKVGDKVLVNAVAQTDGAIDYYIVDFIRSDYLYLLAFIFVAVVLLVGKKKGLKSLLSLVASFFVIINFIIPKIINGENPLTVGVLGALIILIIIIYFTEGWNKKSHISVASVFFSLAATFILSLIFTYLTRLTGLAQEEAVFLLGGNHGSIDFKGLLLAGILVGTIGVLDDVIVGQVELVRQIRQANPDLTNKQVYKSAYEVGNTHLGAIVNTLFLTYAGASLPLLLLFYVNPAGTTTFAEAINSEMIATEIVRTLVGSIGVALSIPISTFLATIWLKGKNLV